MKRILLLSLLLLPIVALAQYPTFSNKQKLGVQTTGDGLIFRGTTINNIPNYTPSNVNNAYFHLDTVQNKLYLYNATTWQLVYPTTQFDTTTLNVYLKISDTTAMLLPYFRDSDTTSLNLINRFALKLNISDTATMLTPYMKKADTISLSNRIDLKLNISDTTILSNRITTNANNIITINNKLATKLDTIYVKFKDVVTMIENKDTINIGSSLTDGYAINIIGDSVNVDSIILDARYPDRDTTNELQDITFATTAGIVTISGGKVMNLDTLYNSVIDSVNLLIRDSIAAFTPLTEGYGINIIGDSINVDTSIIFTQSDTITLSNRIDTKLNASDTASLSNRIDLKLNISDTLSMLAPYLREADTINLSNRIDTKIDTIYVNYQTNVDVITNKDTINITPLTEGFGINVIGDSINIDSAVILATQQKQIAYVKNQSGVTIYKGQAVYSSGSSGNNKLVSLASSSTEQLSSKTFGIVESDVIPNGGHGYIITFGLLSGINTNALTEGSTVYLSNTPGELTTTKPQAPLHMVVVGICIRQQQNNGSIFVKIQNGFEFDELHDVRITTPVDKSSIYYNLSENLWRDTTAALLVSDTAIMLNPYLRKLDTISLSNRINLKFNTADTSILGYVTTYSNQYNINGNKTFNNTVSVDSLNATKQAKIQSLTVGKGGYAIIGGTPGGISSTAFGFEALKNNTSGDWNTAIGYQTLLNNNTGWNNVAIGNNALRFNTVGEYNTAIGVDALDLNIVGNYNTAIGYNSGNGNKGSNNIFIGSNSGHVDSVNNVLVIGSAASPLLTGILSGNKKLGININPLNLTSTFQVNSPISDAVKISSNTNSTNLELANSSGNSVFIKSTNRNMVLQTDTTALMYLNGENNKVGILTMNPEQALQVSGTIRVDSLVNSLTPDKLVGANNANDLTDIKIGNGLSFSNDTLKVADNIINSGDTATLLRKDFLGINTNVLVWTEGNKKLLPYFTQVYRNGQLLKSDSQYTITSDSIVTLEEGSYRLGDNITIIAIDNIVALAGSGGIITLQGDVTGSGTNTITTTIGTNKVTNTMLAGSISNDKLNTITATNKVSNSATTATSANTNSAIVTRDNLGNFSAGTITASLNGNANTATTLATGRTIGITGDLTYTSPSFNGSNNVTAVGTLANSGVSAGTYSYPTIVVDTKGRVTSASSNTLPTINNGTLTMAVSGNGLTGSQTFTANQSAAATFTVTSDATSNNTANTIVYRDASGDFIARNITASNFYGIATSAGFANSIKSTTGGVNAFVNFSINTALLNGARVVTIPDNNVTMATTNLSQTFTETQTFNNTIIGSINGNAATATNVAYSGLTGTVPTWNQNTTGTAATITGVYSGTITSSQITTGLGFTPYNATNPNSYISRTGLSFTAGSGAYNNTNGVITIPTNNNQITNGAGYITSSSLSSYLPLTGGTLSNNLNNTLTVNSVATNTNPNISLTASASSPGYHNTNIGVRGVGQTIYSSGIGLQGEATQTDMNGFGSAFGIQGIVNGTGAGGNGSTYGGYFSNTTTVAGNNYGLYVSTASGGDYGIYQTGTGTNYFGSNTGIGGKLDVSSGIDVNGDFTNNLNSNISALFRGYQIILAPNSDYQPTRIHFPNRPINATFTNYGSGIRHKWDGSDARNSFLSIYTSNISNLQIDAVSINSSGNVGIRDTTPSYTLDVNGTFNATGNSLIGGTLNVTGATTLSNTLGVTGITTLNNDLVLQTSGSRTTTAIRHYYGQQSRYAGEIQFQPSGASGSQLAFYTNVSGNNTQVERMKITENGFIYLNNYTNITGSLNVTGAGSIASTLTVYGVTQLNNLAGTGTRMVTASNTGSLSTATTVNQTGLMTTGSTTGSTGSSTAFFDVTHNLGFEPQSVIITSQTISGGSTKIFCEVIGKDASVFRVQAFNLDGSLATNKVVSIYWIAIK